MAERLGPALEPGQRAVSAELRRATLTIGAPEPVKRHGGLAVG